MALCIRSTSLLCSYLFPGSDEFGGSHDPLETQLALRPPTHHEAQELVREAVSTEVATFDARRKDVQDEARDEE